MRLKFKIRYPERTKMVAEHTLNNSPRTFVKFSLTAIFDVDYIGTQAQYATLPFKK
jgi:hypothetical protein